jgi:hypothetical protein
VKKFVNIFTAVAALRRIREVLRPDNGRSSDCRKLQASRGWPAVLKSD